jgi:hypothetical protein
MVRFWYITLAGFLENGSSTMRRASHIQRCFIVLGLLIALLAILFVFDPGLFPGWGATQAEINRSLPSDAIVVKPLLANNLHLTSYADVMVLFIRTDMQPEIWLHILMVAV